MAKARTITIEAEDFPQNPPGNPPTSLRTVTIPDVPPEPLEYDDVTALNNVLSELGASEDGGGFVTVFRECDIAGTKKPDEYLERFAVAEFSLDDLKRRWGSGKYKINVYHSGGAGLAARKVITIAKDPNAVTAASAPQPQAADLTPILQTMQQGFEKLITVMVQAQSRPEQPSRMEMLQEMQIMSEMFKQPAPASAPQAGILEALKLGAEMAANGGGVESNNAWVGKIIDQLGPVLMPAVAGAVQNAATPRPTPARSANPAPAASLPSPTKPVEEENPVNIIVAQYLNMLKRAAEAKAPVEEYADSILASIPPSQVVEIEKMLRPEDWREQLRKMTNAADLHPEWFGSLRNTLLLYIDEDRGEVSTDLTPGNGGDSVATHENANGESTGINTSLSGGTA